MDRMHSARAPQVIVIGMSDTLESVLALLIWIDQRYRGSKMLHMKILRRNGRIYNQMTLRKVIAQIRTVFFDVTRTFHKNGETQ